MTTARTIGVLALLTIGLVGCQAELVFTPGEGGVESFNPGATTEDPAIEPGPAPEGTIARPPGEEMPEDEICRFIDPGSAPMRRLTIAEYHNSVRDLFGFADIPTQAFSPDEEIGGFEANTNSPVNDLHVEQYLRASESIAEVVVNDLGSVLPMDADEPTVRQFISDYGRRAYRRPLEQAEVDTLYGVFDAGRSEYDAATGAQMVIEAMLQSPYFLYRIEVGEPSDEEVVELTDHEIASRLSFFLWGSIPDNELLDRAAAGELSSADQIESEARRMLQDPRARARINDVFTQWLQIDKLATADKQDEAFTEEMRDSMMAETQAFIDHVLWEGDGSVETLLTADYTFVDGNVAGLYGMNDMMGDGMQRVSLPAGRMGILSHPGVLATHGHGQMPVYRGKFIRDSFLCQPTADPPDDIEPLETFQGESLRSKAETRMNATDEGCAACHVKMDGLGLVFGNYDSMGRYQTEDEFGNALDDSGEIIGSIATDQEVDGVGQLATALAGSDEVKSCVSKQFFRYAVSRFENPNSDGCSLLMVDEALQRSGGDMKELLVAMTTTDAFRYRENTSDDN